MVLICIFFSVFQTLCASFSKDEASAASVVTKVHTGGGSAPQWNEMLQLKKGKKLEGLLVQIFHAGITGDELIGVY
jgi:hypothetical protein